MKPSIAAAIVLTAFFVPAASASGRPGTAMVEELLRDLDRGADPCVDFYRYACGGWLDRTELPADHAIWTRSFSAVHERNRELLRTELESAAANPGTDPDRRRLGDFYAACMDQARIEETGTAPLAPWLERIERVGDRDELIALAGELRRIGVSALFGLFVDGDLGDPRTVVAHLSQGGLGLPERDYYLSETPERVELRAAYERHLARMLVATGMPDAEARARAPEILRLETALAEASRPAPRMRLYDELRHRLDARGLRELAPRLNWDRYFAALGRPSLEAINVMTPEYFVALEHQLADADLATLRAYLRYRLVTATASRLPDAVYRDHFDFYARTLAGQQEPQERWKRCIAATEEAMGDAVGKRFVAEHFAGSSREIATEMIDGIVAAFAARLPQLDWMDEETRRAAMLKRSTLARNIGFPDRWRDDSGLAIDRRDFFGSALAAERHELDLRLAEVGGPLDAKRWSMDAQAVNAMYNPLLNTFTYPAGILQPPFFHRDAPAALNYGGIGFAMGHELTHGFDDQGRKFDQQGRLTDWWTPAAVSAFEERAACIREQYDGYEVEPGLHVNGAFTLGENIADNGGLEQAYAALQADRRRRPADRAGAGGLTAEQLFFVAAAQVWCTEISPEFGRLLVQTNEHAPGRFRVIGPVANNRAFAEAFDCPAGSPMNPVDKCSVW